MTLRLAPSILTADLADMKGEIAKVTSADLLHFDVMDLHFVPNLTFGPAMLRRLADITDLPIDAHLMIEDPDRWAPAFAEAGAASVTFHAEAARAPLRLARTLREAGIKVGLALNPGTAVSTVIDLLGEIDMLLVMTVEPGFGGQEFIGRSLAKLREARALADGLPLDIQVDGGISRATIRSVVEAGANVLVVGTAVFDAPDPAGELAALRALALEQTRE
jgi:ribulose-phosphate 3-epimerase